MNTQQPQPGFPPDLFGRFPPYEGSFDASIQLLQAKIISRKDHFYATIPHVPSAANVLHSEQKPEQQTDWKSIYIEPPLMVLSCV